MAPVGSPQESPLTGSCEPTELVRATFRVLPCLSGGLSLSVGALALAGWGLGLPQWASLFVDLPAMMPRSALMAILAGAALMLLAGAPARGRAWLGRVLACAVSATAASTLGE